MQKLLDLLVEHIDAPLLGKIPYLHKPEEQIGAIFKLEYRSLMYMQTEKITRVR